MKKTLCMVFLVAMFMVLAITPAVAQTGFSVNVQCQNENDLTYNVTTLDVNRTLYKTTNNQALYVNHSVSGGSSSYTNMFHATRFNGNSPVLAGSKFCTVGKKIPIQSNAIYNFYHYGVAARGNTKHWLNDGVSRVTLSGNMFDY